MHNLEIKCRYSDQPFAKRTAREALEAEHVGRLVQTDTYFRIRTGRLKLRQNKLYPRGKQPAKVWNELIAYRRRNRQAPRSSAYHLLEVADAAKALSFFGNAFGILVRVARVRELYLADQVRVHLDTVAGLGKFLEFELAIDAEHPLASCRRQMARLLEVFQVPGAALIRYSYADLLMAQLALNR